MLGGHLIELIAQGEILLEWPKGGWPPVIIKTLGYHQGWGKGKASEKSRAFIFRWKQGFVKIIKDLFIGKKSKKHPNFI